VQILQPRNMLPHLHCGQFTRFKIYFFCFLNELASL